MAPIFSILANNKSRLERSDKLISPKGTPPATRLSFFLRLRLPLILPFLLKNFPPGSPVTFELCTTAMDDAPSRVLGLNFVLSFGGTEPDRQDVGRRLRHNRKPCCRLLRRCQLSVMPENHLRGITRFQRPPIYILNFRESITDERMPQRVLLPLDLRVRCSVSHRLKKPSLAALPNATVIARCNCQPAREIF